MCWHLLNCNAGSDHPLEGAGEARVLESFGSGLRLINPSNFDQVCITRVPVREWWNIVCTEKITGLDY